jgi:hypothetical protein
MPTVYHLALMAEHIYAQDDSGIYAASFSKPAPSGLPDRSSLKRVSQIRDSAFAAALYETDDGMTIVYRGTETAPGAVPSDESAQSVAPQFAHAVAFAEKAIDTHHLVPANTFFCGHSLGGALANYVAHRFAQGDLIAAAAVSFNGPGLSVSMLDKALVAGMTQLTEDLAIGVGISAVNQILQQDDVPRHNQTHARLINISLDGDIVSKIGDAAGLSFTLTAPEFVVPKDFELRGGLKLPETRRARYVFLREMYLHSIHTLRRVLADDPLGQKQASSLLDTAPT